MNLRSIPRSKRYWRICSARPPSDRACGNLSKVFFRKRPAFTSAAGRDPLPAFQSGLNAELKFRESTTPDLLAWGRCIVWRSLGAVYQYRMTADGASRMPSSFPPSPLERPQRSPGAKAVSKDGKPLAGAAKTSSIKKCCEEAAVSQEGSRWPGQQRLVS